MSRATVVLALARSFARSRWVLAAQIAVTLALAIWIVTALDARAWAALRRVDPWELAGSILLFASAQIFCGLRLAVLLRDTPIPSSEAVVTTWIGYFFSNFLPSTIGGDVVRLGRLTMAGLNPAAALGVLPLDRAINLGATATIFALSTTPALTKTVSLASPSWTRLAIAAAAVLCLGAIAGLALWRSARLRTAAMAVLNPTRRLMRHPVRLVAVIALSVLSLGVAILAQWFVALAIGISIGLAGLAAIICLVALIVLVPISLNGLGLQEGAFVFFLTQTGVPLELSLVYGLLTRVLIVAAGAIGGLVLVYDRVTHLS